MEADLDAKLYALIHRGQPGDVAHYRARCRGARSALELGCGDARILAALAADGIEAWGVELDRGRVREARRRLTRLDHAARARAHVLHADMRAFALERTFDRVLIPYSGLWALGGRAGMRACLGAACAHLDPGGYVHFDVWNVARDEVPGEVERDPAPRPLTRVEVDGRRIDVFESDLWDPAAQRVEATYRFVIGTGASRTVRCLTVVHDYLFVDELDDLLTASGLRVVERRGGFRGERFTRRCAVAVLTCGTAPRPS